MRRVGSSGQQLVCQVLQHGHGQYGAQYDVNQLHCEAGGVGDSGPQSVSSTVMVRCKVTQVELNLFCVLWHRELLLYWYCCICLMCCSTRYWCVGTGNTITQ